MNRPSILLVEDDPQEAELTLHALNRSGFTGQITRLSDGASALEYMFKTGADGRQLAVPLPRLILLDLKLPKVDGLEVLRRLKSDRRTQMTPVVMLTSSSEERDVRESYRSGVNSYLVKPVDFNEFMKCVAQVSLYWLTCNQPPPATTSEV